MKHYYTYSSAPSTRRSCSVSVLGYGNCQLCVVLALIDRVRKLRREMLLSFFTKDYLALNALCLLMHLLRLFFPRIDPLFTSEHDIS